MGRIYAAGDGTAQDLGKSVEWYRKAADQGFAPSQVNLGYAYQYGLGVKRDSHKAVELYQKAADQGNPSGESLLGWCFYNGTGVPKDLVKAFEWHKKAADSGYAESQRVIGYMYGQGEGVPKDDVQSVAWNLKASAQGETTAQYNLGLSYANGTGVPQDYVLSYAYLNLAAAGGKTEATQSRTLLEMRMSPVQIAEAQRLSSAWTQGQVLARNGESVEKSSAPTNPAAALEKRDTGTLFFVSTEGQGVTNHHVVDGCREIRVQGRDGIAKLVTEDSINDLALVQVSIAASAAATLATDPSKMRQGEDIVVFGFPLNSVLSSGGNLTPGIVSALTGLGNNSNQIQITAPIQPGSSGSPVINLKGEVVGVVSMKLSDSAMTKATGQVAQAVNFAVNGQTLRTFLDANHVSYKSGVGFLSFSKSAADLAEEARKWTVVVECWK